MKQFKQLAALFLAFALVIGVFSTPTVAYAEDVLTSTDIDVDNEVDINYAEEKLEISKAADENIYYAFKYTEKSHANIDWDKAFVASSGAIKATIDFSNVSGAKDVTVYITNDKTKKPVEKVIKAEEKNLRVAFSGVPVTTVKSKIKLVNDWTSLTDEMPSYSSTEQEPWAYGYLCIAVGKGTEAKPLLATEAKFIQFKKGIAGTWQSIENLDLRKYVAYGAQLYFRIKPKADGDAVVSGGAITALGRASKEVKVTYTKQAKAPKATINGVTKEIKLAKTQEYRVTNASGSGLWTKVADNHMTGTKVNKVYLKDLLTASGSAWDYSEGVEGQSIEIRIAASDKGAASKIQKIALNKATVPDISSGGAVQFALVKNTTFDKGLIVKNTTGPAIQVAVVSGDSFDINNTKLVKWVTIAAGRQATLAGKVLATGNKILVRTATIKENTKTATTDFIVSSDYVVKEKSSIELQPQSFEVNSATLASAVTGVTATASGSSLNYTVTVKNTASPAAITVVAGVATSNVVGTPIVKRVNEMSTTAPIVTDTSITATATAINSNATKITFKIPATTAINVGSKLFRVTVDGVTAYITVNYVNS